MSPQNVQSISGRPRHLRQAACAEHAAHNRQGGSAVSIQKVRLSELLLLMMLLCDATLVRGGLACTLGQRFNRRATSPPNNIACG